MFRKKMVKDLYLKIWDVQEGLQGDDKVSMKLRHHNNKCIKKQEDG